MPYKRKYKKRKPRRKTKSNFLTLNGPGFGRPYPLPQSFRYIGRYADTAISIDPGSGGIASTQVYRLNSLFDPDRTGGGHQPLGFDELMPLYDHYTVISAKVRFTATNLDDISAQQVTLQIKDTDTVSTATNAIVENGMCRWTILDVRGGGKATQTLSLSVSMNKFFQKNVLDEDAYRADITSNPNEQVYLHVQVDPVTTNDTQPVRGMLIIEYTAMLREPKQLGTS